jgi:hypothetical protein
VVNNKLVYEIAGGDYVLVDNSNTMLMYEMARVMMFRLGRAGARLGFGHLFLVTLALVVPVQMALVSEAGFADCAMEPESTIGGPFYGELVAA